MAFCSILREMSQKFEKCLKNLRNISQKKEINIFNLKHSINKIKWNVKFVIRILVQSVI